MVKRIIGAAVRAVLMAFLVMIPSLLLPSTTTDTAQMAALVALVAALVAYSEYYAEYPSFLEFRDAAPFNRLRYLGLLFCVLFLSMIAAAPDRATLVSGLSLRIANILDFPFSPVRLMMIALSDARLAYDIAVVRGMVSIALFVTLVTLFLFWLHVRLIFWPIRRKPFNFWINLPLFDPTIGRDVLYRLKRDANVNLALGFLLPFLIPALVQFWVISFETDVFTTPEVMIWMICAWAFLPLTLMMRGLALLRVAALIEEKRRRAYAQSDDLQLA